MAEQLLNKNMSEEEGNNYMAIFIFFLINFFN